MIVSCLFTLVSHWYRNPLQIFAYLSGVALATALWSGVQAINHEAKGSYRAAAQTLGEGQYDLIRPKQHKTISVLDYVNLRKSGWLVSPVVDGYLDNIRLLGMDPLRLPSSFLFSQYQIYHLKNLFSGSLTSFSYYFFWIISEPDLSFFG